MAEKPGDRLLSIAQRARAEALAKNRYGDDDGRRYEFGHPDTTTAPNPTYDPLNILGKEPAPGGDGIPGGYYDKFGKPEFPGSGRLGLYLNTYTPDKPYPDNASAFDLE